MAVFYLMPPRPQVGRQLSEALSQMFPGLGWRPESWNDLAEALGVACSQSNSFVVFREDLPDDEEVHSALQRHFGAEEGDEIIEIQSPVPLAGELARRREPAA